MWSDTPGRLLLADLTDGGTHIMQVGGLYRALVASLHTCLLRAMRAVRAVPCLQVDMAIQYGEDAEVKIRDEPDADMDDAGD